MKGAKSITSRWCALSIGPDIQKVDIVRLSGKQNALLAAFGLAATSSLGYSAPALKKAEASSIARTSGAPGHFEREPTEENVQSIFDHHQSSRDHGAVPRGQSLVGNVPMPGVFPDYPAPVVRNAGGERELTMMRWGMPPPPRAGGAPVTNIRNTSSPHWRVWLKPENRCLVPATASRSMRPNRTLTPKRKTLCGSP